MTAWTRRRITALLVLLAAATLATAPPAAAQGAGDDGLPDTLVLEGVVFEIGSAELTPESLPHLDRAAALVLAAPAARVEVGGHTDSSGPADLNRALSKQRAETVRDYLVLRGVAADRVIAVGYGEAYPIADNATGEGRARNRRVELKRLEP